MSASPDYLRWYPGAIALAGSLLNSQAQAKDVVQQAVALLIERGEYLGAHRQAWFFTVVRNACIDELRRQRKFESADTPFDCENEHPGPAEDYLAKERQQQIRHALQTLKFEQREILLLRDVNDLSYADIAQVLTINVGTVMSRLHRARLALRQALQIADAKPGLRSVETTPTSSALANSELPAKQSGPLPKEAL